MKSAFGKLKNILVGIFVLLIILVKIIYDIQMTKNRTEALSTTGSYMSEVPWSIAYVVGGIVILYFLGKLPFFKSIQIKRSDEKKKLTLKEAFATIIFGLLVLALGVGFVAIVFQGME